LLFLVFSCSQEPEEIDKVPSLSFLGFKGDSAVNAKYSYRDSNGLNIEVKDTLILRFEFRDGDGNLGHKDNDTISNWVYIPNSQGSFDTLRGSIFLRDSRTDFLTAYSFPNIENGNNNSLTGEIEITIDHLFCSAFASDTERLYYSAYLMDRDSQVSDVINTDTFLIICN